MKTRKAYICAWTKKARKKYGISSKDNFLTVEPIEEERKFVKDFSYHTTPFAIFGKRKEAVAFIDNNKDWMIIPCEIKF